MYGSAVYKHYFPLGLQIILQSSSRESALCFDHRLLSSGLFILQRQQSIDVH